MQPWQGWSHRHPARCALCSCLCPETADTVVWSGLWSCRGCLTAALGFQGAGAGSRQVWPLHTGEEGSPSLHNALLPLPLPLSTLSLPPSLLVPACSSFFLGCHLLTYPPHPRPSLVLAHSLHPHSLWAGKAHVPGSLMTEPTWPPCGLSCLVKSQGLIGSDRDEKLSVSHPWMQQGARGDHACSGRTRRQRTGGNHSWQVVSWPPAFQHPLCPV